jgi:RNA polymerase sigma factor (sigma-70 family)
MTPTSTEPTVFVVDDDPAVLKALSRLLRSAGLRVETFAACEAFLARDDPQAPGCLLLDVALPGLDGLALQRRLAEARQPRPIVFLTGHGDIPMGIQAMKDGATDFLTKPAQDEALLGAVRTALERDREARQARAVLADIERGLAALTPREREVLRHVVAGKPNKQVAAELETTEKTIKVHRARVMSKMQASSLPDLVRMAAQAGIAPAFPAEELGT